MWPNTQIKLDYIKSKLTDKYSTIQIAKDLNTTKQCISRLIKVYLPELKKCNRKLQYLPQQRLTDLQRSQHLRFQRKRENCKHLGLEFTIKLEDLTWPSHCPILGLELDYYAPARQENSVSFDRIDSNKGYIRNNVQIVSWRANRIKNDGTADEHRKIADYLDHINST